MGSDAWTNFHTIANISVIATENCKVVIRCAHCHGLSFTTPVLGGKTNYHLALPWIEDDQIVRGLEIVNKFQTELEYLDFARHIEAVDKVEKKDDHFAVTTASGKIFESKTVILATRTRQVRMNVPGEKDYTMKGLCYSALSYAPCSLINR